MGYVSNDSSLWFNLAGCVAAYQPVLAPGPLHARYNQVAGGVNRFKAIDGVAPAWAERAGWTFTNSTNRLDTQIILNSVWAWSFAAKIYVNGTGGGGFGRLLAAVGTYTIQMVPANSSGNHVYQPGGSSQLDVAGALAGYRTFGMSYSIPYLDGRVDGASTIDPSYLYPTGSLFIGNRSAGDRAFDGRVLALAIYARKLTSAEMASVMQQMNYCDVNPDWSAWGRRRQWYYMPSPSFLAAWAARSNEYIGPDNGVSL